MTLSTLGMYHPLARVAVGKLYQGFDRHIVSPIKQTEMEKNMGMKRKLALYSGLQGVGTI